MNTKNIEAENISWRLLRGNKYNRALHPAMVLASGCSKLMAVTPVGEEEKKWFNVKYDRDYVQNWIKTKLIKPLENLPIEELVTLVIEAYCDLKDEPTVKFELKQSNEDQK